MSNGRGPDQVRRELRGPPSAATLVKRKASLDERKKEEEQTKKAATRRNDTAGFNIMLQGSTGVGADSTVPPESSHSATGESIPRAAASTLLPAAYPVSDDTVVLVGGVNVSLQPPQQDSSAPLGKRAHGDRQADKKQRKKRACKKCIANDDPESSITCKGRAARGKCKYDLSIPPV
jgi:hypothetical protein